MFLDLNKIGDQPIEFDRELQVADRFAEGADPDPSPTARIERVHIVGSLAKGPRGNLLAARIRANAALPCVRCLEPFETAIDARFELVAVREEIVLGGRDTPLGRDELDLYQAVDGKIDLTDVAVEQLHLNIPLKPICRPDCKGLCPTCGGNRNRIRCDCRSEEVDPRLAPLLDFKPKQGNH